MIPPLTAGRIAELSRAFARKRIVVLGDVMLDHYLHGDVRRISPEAPVPVVEFGGEYHRPGGAANVAGNLAALGARPELLGVAGTDESASHLQTALREAGIPTRGLITTPDRCTTVKTRVLAHQQQMIRIDRESRRPLPTAVRQRLLRRLRTALRGAAAVVIADYAKGVVDQTTLDAVLALGRTARVPVCLDPKPVHSLRIAGCDLLTPNRREAFELAGLPDEPVGAQPARHRGLLQAMSRIHRIHRPGILLVTLGEAGMIVQERGGAPRHLPTAARTVYDVSGAGDTVIASFVLARTAGATAVEAAALANLAAGIVVGKLGVATVTPAELSAWCAG